MIENKSINYQSSKIFYRVIGKGKPVVLIHGFGEDGTIWGNQVTFLQYDFQLIIPDLPGSGQSGMIPDMSIEGMAELIYTIIGEEIKTGNSATVLGHSMGGYITLALAEKYPGVLTAFGLVHSSAFADSEEKKITRRKAIDFIEKNGAYEFLKTSIPDLFYKGPEKGNFCAAQIESLVKKGRQFTPDSLIAYYIAMINRPDRTAILKNFSGPVLFIIGKHDKAIPFEQSMQQCYLPNRSDVNIVCNSAHMGIIEETEKVNQVLKSFLQDID